MVLTLGLMAAEQREPKGLPVAQPGPTQQSQPTAESDKAKQPAQPAPSPAVSEQQKEQARAAQEREQRAEERDKQDLIAQQRMADAAVGLEEVSWIQVYIGWGGLILLAATTTFAALAWLAARRGAKAAEDALPHAKRAADGTIQAAEAAQKAADAAIGVEVARPILTSIGPTPGGHIRVWLKSSDLRAEFENQGRTAAVVTETCLVWKVADELHKEPVYPSDTINFLAQPSLYEPKEPFGVKRPIALTDDEIGRVVGGDTMLWAYGYVKFQDFLNVERVVGFCRVLEPLTDKRYPTQGVTRGRFRTGGTSTYTYNRIVTG